MRKKYLTVKNAGQGIYEEKKSEFIANVLPITTEKQALDFINAMRTRYYDARHNVYAYYVVENGVPTQRYSDDGEPSGTAGIPTLEAFRKRDIEDVCVVVTRYFGGTLLGAAGLIRAYGKATTLGIDNCEVICRQLVQEVKCEVDYSLVGKLQNYIFEKDVICDNVEYLENVKFTLLCEESEVDRVKEEIIDLTNANAYIIDGEKHFIDRANYDKI